MPRPYLILLILALSAALGTRLAADDWPQYRKDSGRSAASRDKLRPPLADIWSWSSRLRDGHTSLFNCAVWRDRVFFTACENGKRWLVGADARTGTVHWRQPLDATKLRFELSDSVGPAVSASGLVFVYDWLSPKANDKQTVQSLSRGRSFTVTAFQAESGSYVDAFPLAAGNGVLPRLSLLHTAEGQAITAAPDTMIGPPH